MRSRRHRREKMESLDLLLDTMCNSLGGIILIALLIALLSQDTDLTASINQSARMQREQMERQISEAEQLQRTLIKSGDTNAMATLTLLTEQEEMERKVNEMMVEAESNSVVQARLEAAIDPGETQRLLSQKQIRENEMKSLEEQIEKELKSQQRQLRLPKERVTGKRTFYFIARFGKLYPVHFMRDGQRELNRQTLDWTSVPQGESVAPRRDAGVDLQTFARLLNEVPAQTYSIHFLAYNDSFPLFLTSRQVPLARGFDTGWEFLSEDKPIIFSSRGEAPPAL